MFVSERAWQKQRQTEREPKYIHSQKTTHAQQCAELS